MSGTLRQARHEREKGGGGAAPAGAAGRTGLFFCRCGPNLGDVVRLGELACPLRWPRVHEVATHDVLCSGEGQAWLAERMRAGGLDRVVIAACSPREHEHTFRSVLAAEGRSPCHLQVVNVREQVDWIGGDPALATERARRLVAAGLARVALHVDLPREEVEVSLDVLVVGAGAAGVSAALALGRRDRKVLLVERAPVVGGLANRLDAVFPALECASCFMEPALDEVLHSEGVEVLTGAEVRRVRGGQGRFEVELALQPRGVDPERCLGCGSCSSACPAEVPDPWAAGLATRKAIGLAYAGCLPHVSALDPAACLRARGEPCEACRTACPFGAVTLDGAVRLRRVTVGSIVVATGMSPGDVAGPEGLVSSFRLERMLHPDGPTRGAVRGAGGREPRAVLLGTTAAEEDGALAAAEILKLAEILRSRLPGAEVAVAGGLERIPSLARRAAALAAAGVRFLPGHLAPERVLAAGGRLAARLGDGERDEPRVADLVVIHAPAGPAEGADALARLLRVGAGERGFLHDRGASPFEPTATRIAGVFVAGAAAGPRPIADAIRDGAAAAGLVLASLGAGEKKVVEPLAAEIDEARCAACGVCASVCPFGAIDLKWGGLHPADGPLAELDWRSRVTAPPTPPELAPGQPHPAAPALAASPRKARVERLHCRGCGTCAAACPTGAASAPHFTSAQIAAEISALLAGSAPGGR